MTDSPLPASMRVLRAHHRGGPDALVVEETMIPAAGPDEVLVAVHAAAITFDELRWDETWSHLPSTPSHEWSGTVAALGGTAGLTAHQALVDHANVGPGDDVLVLGGAGGVGPSAHPSRSARSTSSWTPWVARPCVTPSLSCGPAGPTSACSDRHPRTGSPSRVSPAGSSSSRRDATASPGCAPRSTPDCSG